MLAAPASIQQAPPDQSLDIVVTARPGAPRELPGAAEWFRRLCVDPNRANGRSAAPSPASEWRPLGPDLRARFGAADPAVEAYGLADPERGSTLLLRIERPARPDGLAESRCTLVVAGGRGGDGLANGVSALMGGPPTERHVGHPAGSDRIEGWRQQLWTAMPARGSPEWRIAGANTRRRDASTTWIVVTDPGFYRGHDHVAVDLKTRRDGTRPVAALTLTLVGFPRQAR